MALLTLTPSRDGYSVRDSVVSDTSQLKGGLSRTRRDLLTSSSGVSVMWRLNRARYEALMTFYRTTLVNGSEAFEIDLVMDEPELTRHTAHFIPGTLQLSGVDGATYVVVAELEVIPLPVDEDADNTIMDLYEIYGSPAAEDLLLALAQFVNVTLPANLS